jgi:predicted ATPase with chaperone activity
MSCPKNEIESEKSEVIRQRVIKARNLQEERFKEFTDCT